MVDLAVKGGGAPVSFWERLRQVKGELVTRLGRARSLALVALILILLGLVGFLPGTSRWLDRGVYDLFLVLLSPHQAPDPRLVIVAIDTEALETIGLRWPWPRAEFARLLEAIAQNNPRAIILDILLQNPQDGDGGKNDQVLAGTLRRLGKVGLISIIETFWTERGLDVRNIPCLELFRDAAFLEGFVWAVVDSDGLTRSVALRDERLGKESCVLQLARHFGVAVDLPAPDEDGVSQCLLPLPRWGGGIPVVSAMDVLEERVPPSFLQDRVVFVGVSASILHDEHRMPFGVVAGVEILAASFDALLKGWVVQPRTGAGGRLLATLMGWLLGAGLVFRPWSHPWLRSGAALTGLIVAGWAALWAWGWYLPMGAFILAWLFGSLTAAMVIAFLDLVRAQIMRAEAGAIGEIQRMLFPAKPFEHPKGFICAGRCLPCEEAGGDYFDFFPLGEDRLVFMIGDVTGHGFGAAMLTTIVKAIVSQFRQAGALRPADLLTTLNQVILDVVRRKRMITLVVGSLQFATGEVELAYGGHLPAFLLKQTGEIEERAQPAFPVGSSPLFRPNSLSFSLDPGDRLVFYTDGFVEAVNWENKPFEFKRWKEYCGTWPQEPFDHLWDRTLGTVRSHTEGRPFVDDVTLMIIERRAVVAQEG